MAVTFKSLQQNVSTFRITFDIEKGNSDDIRKLLSLIAFTGGYNTIPFKPELRIFSLNKMKFEQLINDLSHELARLGN